MSSTTDATFPRYPGGDVLIVLSPSRQYQLHSTTLRLCSTFFREALVEENAAQLSAATKYYGEAYRYRFELELPNAGDGDIDCDGEIRRGYDDPDGNEGSGALNKSKRGVGKLRMRRLDDRGRPLGTPFTTAGINDSPFSEPDLLTHYDNALRSFFHIPLRLSETSGLHALLRDVLGLVEVAEALGSIACVSASLDVSLMKYGQTLFRSIAANPSVWAELGVRIRSEVVVREAVCHLVGQWHSASVRDRVSWGPGEATAALRRLVESKAASLDAARRAAEVRLMGYYPDVMMWSGRSGQPNVAAGSRTTRGSGVPTNVGRHTKNIYHWMAVNLFRHWMGQHVCADRTRGASDGGYGFYNCIAKAGEEYIDQQSRESFTRYFPLSAKARTGFDRAVGQVKEGVKKYVAGLVWTSCALDVKKYPVEWLTCTEVCRDEMPWAVTGQEGEAMQGEYSVRDKEKSRKRQHADSEENQGNAETAKTCSKKQRVRFSREAGTLNDIDADMIDGTSVDVPARSIEEEMHFEIGEDLLASQAEGADGLDFDGNDFLDDEYGEGCAADETWDADDEYGE